MSVTIFKYKKSYKIKSFEQISVLSVWETKYDKELLTLI